MLKKLFKEIKTDLQTIEQRFFYPGHSINDCNRCFDIIERKRRTAGCLYTPDDYINLISSAKQSKPAFEVYKMTENDFFSNEHLLNFMNDVTADRDKIAWLNVKSIIYDRSEMSTVRVNYFNQNYGHIEFHDEFHTADSFNSTVNLISKSKYDDLMKTLKYIPEEKHPFFESIKYDVNLIDADFVLASHEEQ